MKQTQTRTRLPQPQTPLAPPRVGEKLLAANLITSDELRIALFEQKKTGERLGTILVRLGFVDENILSDLLASRTGLMSVDLDTINADPDLAGLIPADVAKRCKVLPLEMSEAGLQLAMADPYDVRATDEIQRYLPPKMRITPRVASASAILSALDGQRGAHAAIEQILHELEDVSALEADAAPIIRLANELLTDAIHQGASDIHLEPEENMVRVRYRIDGVLHQVRALHKNHWQALSQRLKLLAHMNIANRRAIQDGRFSLDISGRTVDFRAALLPTVWGENIVVRVLDKKKALLPLADLGFSPTSVAALIRMIEKPQGLTLVTGPTGSGKTTTLYSLLSRLSSTEVHVATLEEPVEYRLGLIRQTSIDPTQGIDFASAIRAVLRQDPDIIFIGEIRDAETAQMALRAAMTGHKVFATLHCNDVWGAVPRLTDLGINPALLSDNLSGVVAQRLVRKLCPKCKVPCFASDEDCTYLCHDPSNPPQIAVPAGCTHCHQIGHKGRTVVAEALVFTQELDELYTLKASRRALETHAISDGFISMRQDGLTRVQNQEIALSELRRSVDLGTGRS